MELTGSVVEGLRAAFAAAGYTVEGVAERLGVQANGALARNETTLAVRRTGGGDALDTMIRLFLLQQVVPKELVDKAFPGIDLVALGIVSGDRAVLDIRPFAEDEQQWWVIADLTPGLDGRREPMRDDYVLGIAPASLSLVHLTVPIKAERALDIGTGCGIQTLHLANRVNQLVATDVNPRALELAKATAALNRIDLDVRTGSLFEPVAGERFDLIISNPPYVISPPDSQLTYRETSFAGDRLVQQLVQQAPQHLTDGGWCQLLANWTCVRGEDWRDRLATWTGDRSAWAVQREQLDPSEYVELWLRDAGLHGTPAYPSRYDEWMRWLEDQQVEAIGMGWITVHNVAGALDAEEWPYEIERPIGPHVLRRFERQEGLPADLTGLHLVVADDVIQETTGQPGAEDPATIVLRRQRGMRRAEQVDTVMAGFVGACDGELNVGQILAALADLLDRQLVDVLTEYLPQIRRLLVEGFLDY
ncbi:class I SAM-dependent methyltransferase [Kribbella albertanoniae]|uniref:Methyltransferase domain-containing protein n=1 Tax=Kribbella albertanoniae TaxID=1266829 RepID=A0A4R4NXI1_9ACTN|nr:methyltransferase [Kribbella albertanoniae]TDC14558.1 methyltransferase domain-containing protein [Kribbella albertanoniae]